ncbi:CASPA protein, partial [Piaya cayana]|nr:CASPA protein [Piaya cayana]
LLSGRETVGSSNMEDDVNSKFLQQLLLIGEDLVAEDVSALKFLCTDLLPFRKLENVKSAMDIFQFLMDEDYLNEEDPFLLAELLYRIRCYSLLRKFGYTKEKVQECLHRKGRVSSYRQMLYDLSVNITDKMLMDIVFILQDYIPKRLTTLSALELLIFLEKQGILSENKVQKLEEVCMCVSPDLLEIVNCYKRTKACMLVAYGVEAIPCLYFGTLLAVRFFLLDLIWFRKGTNVFAQHARNRSLKGSLGNGTVCSGRWLTCLLWRSYKMDGPHRGFCIVINNVNFGNSLPKRRGSCKDAEELRQVFTWLGLDVKVYKDLTSQQIEDLMLMWQRSPDHKDRDCFICCILSHGESGAIYGNDAKAVSIRKIMSHFTAKQCPQLAKKPKLFFIQACQGKAIQHPVYIEADAQTPSSSSMQQSPSSESIPEEADFLLGMATINGCVSFRHIEEGTWYIQALCSNLQLLVPRGEDILSILTEVNEDVSRRVDPLGTKKQMPQPAYTLRRKVIFPIPKEPPPS